MSAPYAGANLFPTDFLIPDDGDAENATSINVALEALGDRTVYNKTALADYIADKSPRMRITTFTASGTYTPGASSRIVAAWVWGCGGGGAGGNGQRGPTSLDFYFAGGGGGGAAIPQLRPVTLTPGTTYNIDIGAGGTPGAAFGDAGGDGGDTLFRNGATNLAVFPGAKGGDAPQGTKVAAAIRHFVLGGLARREMQSLTIGTPNQNIRFDPADAMWLDGTPEGMSITIPMQPGQGGWGARGLSGATAGTGNPNPHGRFSGGTGGAVGADDGTTPTKRGGGGGGGGGAGPFGDGGNGGNGNDALLTAAGINGAAAAANTGAGGGGGGSGGYDSPTGGTAGYGGGGGSGRLYLITIEESP